MNIILAGNPVGPQITLSSTVLKTDEVLTYTCIENGDDEDNRLSKLLPGGGIQEIGKS